MESEGWSYEQALAEAQKIGYAEANPKSDVEGEYAAAKLVVLARLASGAWPALSHVQFDDAPGITGVTAAAIADAATRGARLRMLASWENGGDDATKDRLAVRVTEVPADSRLGTTVGGGNLIVISGDLIGDLGAYLSTFAVFAITTMVALFALMAGLAFDWPKPALVQGAAQTLFLLFTMASVGLPGTSNFVGEFLSLMGTYQVSTWIALLCTTSIILGAAYMLYLYRRIAFGEIKSDEVRAMEDLSHRELWLLAPIAAVALWMGVYPESFMAPMRKDVAVLLRNVPRMIFFTANKAIFSKKEASELVERHLDERERDAADEDVGGEQRPCDPR